jgi:hypothetical protein
MDSTIEGFIEGSVAGGFMEDSKQRFGRGSKLGDFKEGSPFGFKGLGQWFQKTLSVTPLFLYNDPRHR